MYNKHKMGGNLIKGNLKSVLIFCFLAVVIVSFSLGSFLVISGNGNTNMLPSEPVDAKANKANETNNLFDKYFQLESEENITFQKYRSVQFHIAIDVFEAEIPKDWIAVAETHGTSQTIRFGYEFPTDDLIKGDFLNKFSVTYLNEKYISDLESGILPDDYGNLDAAEKVLISGESAAVYDQMSLGGSTKIIVYRTDGTLFIIRAEDDVFESLSFKHFIETFVPLGMPL